MRADLAGANIDRLALLIADGRHRCNTRAPTFARLALVHASEPGCGGFRRLRVMSGYAIWIDGTI